MKAIVVVDEKWGIGHNGNLLTHLSGDLKYFKEKTLGKVVVMGRKTLESLPGGQPLPNRTNIVLSKGNKEIQKISDYPSEDIYIVGGAQIYELFLDKCDEIFVTKIKKTFLADVHFRNLDKDGRWKLTEESEIQKENDTEYTFCTYKKCE